MDTSELLIDAFERIKGVVHRALGDLSADELSARLDPAANTIGWLVWHLTRIQDDHVADVAGSEQVYVSGGWWQKLGQPFDVTDHGYGHTGEQVGSLRIASAQLLLDYYDAVHEHTVGYVRDLTDEALNRVVDIRWDPPVTLGVRLISVVSDDLQHAGQAAFIRGALRRTE
jgi:hypothetical protein